MHHRPSEPNAATDEAGAIQALLAADVSGSNGDDAALVAIPGSLAVITTDVAIDGVHLHADLTPWQRGYRAAACALSDLAAMAAVARAVTCGVSVPDGAWADVAAVMAGVEARATEHGCHVVGGDLTAAAPSGTPGHWSVAVTCIGAVAGRGRAGAVMRTGASPGDGLYVTGSLGASLAGLHAGVSSPLWERYCNPPDRSAAGRTLAPWARAMLDVSDGLATDIPRLCAASGCGAGIDLDLLPVDDEVATALARRGDARTEAATGGDDYELLVAMRTTDAPLARAALAALPVPVALTRIGTCTDGDVSWSADGAPVEGLRGYLHG